MLTSCKQPLTPLLVSRSPEQLILAYTTFLGAGHPPWLAWCDRFWLDHLFQDDKVLSGQALKLFMISKLYCN